MWLPFWWVDNVNLGDVVSFNIPSGVSQATTPVTSVSTEGGSTAVHVSVRSEPLWNVVSETLATGTAVWESDHEDFIETHSE